MPEEEVELHDYLKVISKRKWLIIAGTLVCVFTAGIVSLLLPKVYEATLDLTIGKVWDSPIENPYVVSETITTEAFLVKVINKLKLKSFQDLKGAVKASVFKESNLIRLTVKADTPTKTVKIVNAIANLIIDSNKDKYDKAMIFYYQYEKNLTTQIANVNSNITKMRATFSHLEKDVRTNGVAAVLLQAQLEQRETQLVILMRELRDVRTKNYSPIHSQMSSVENPTVEPTAPVAPRKKQIVVIAAVLGAFVFLFLAFFLEYLGRMKERESSISRNSKEG